MQLRRLHGGHHSGIPTLDRGDLSPTIPTPNSTEAPAVTYEYLFYLPLIDRLRPPAH
jgi:hypothetical protein